MKYLPLIWAGLWRKKARTIFTMLSIVVAFLLFGLIQGINQGFNTAMTNLNVDRLYVSAKSNMTDGLPYSQYARIKAVPGVRAVSHWTYFGGYYQDAKTPLPAFATEASGLFEVYRELKVKPEYLEAMKNTRTGALVSETLLAKHHWKIGDRIPLGTSIWTNKAGSNTWPVDIVGTFDTSSTGGSLPGFYINYSYFDEFASFGNGVIHYYMVGIEDPRQATRIARAIDAMFENSSNETRTQTESEVAQQQIKQLGDINFIANAIVGAVLFTLLFLTANTMMQSVRERTSELAVLKTLGFSDNKVVALVLVESLLLCLFAAFVGLGVASAIFPQLKALMGEFGMPPVVVAAGTGIAIAMALISGLPPAWRARQLNIVDALAGR